MRVKTFWIHAQVEEEINEWFSKQRDLENHDGIEYLYTSITQSNGVICIWYEWQIDEDAE